MGKQKIAHERKLLLYPDIPRAVEHTRGFVYQSLGAHTLLTTCISGMPILVRKPFIICLADERNEIMVL